MSGEPATPPLAGPNTVELGLEGQRLKVVEGAGKPPRDREEFTSSPLGLALAMFAKGLVLLPHPPQHSAHPSRPWAQWSSCCMDSEGLALPRSRGQSQLLCPRSIHIVAGFSPSQDPWCHGAETSKSETDNQEGGRQADRTGLGDHEQTQ